jgi:hypothetical protein
MALQGKLSKNNVSNSYRTDFEKAYFRVDDVLVDLSNSRVRAHLRGYAEEYARHNKATGVYKKVVYIPLKEFGKVLCTKEKILEVVYAYLKKLDEFKHLKDHKKEYKGAKDFEAPEVDRKDEESVRKYDKWIEENIDVSTDIDETILDKI